MRKAIVFEAPREGYSIDQVADGAMTVGELMAFLEDFDEDVLIIMSHDRGYTYGSKVGQEVYLQDFTGEVKLVEVVGIGEDRNVNGTNVNGIPYTNIYGMNEESRANNINNYLRNPEYIVHKE